MKRAFIDTGYLIALEVSDDQHHEDAVAHWSDFAATTPGLITTSYVFDEVVTFFNSRGRHEKAVDVGTRLRSSKRVELIQVSEDLFERGWTYFQVHKDKRYSLTDCISFVVMNRWGLRTALAFDRHFEQAGFQRQP